MLAGMDGPGRKSEPEVRQFGQPLGVRLARLADAQHGAVSLSQLTTLGLSARAVQKRVAAGRLHRVHRGVYAVGRAGLDARGRRMAAVLACGPGAVISHRTAADELGISPRASALIEVSIPSRSGRARPGVVVHRAPGLGPADVTTLNRIPSTTAARTQLDLAAVVNASELARTLEATERKRLFDLTEVTAALDRAPGHPGAGRLLAALAAYAEPPPTRREFERLAFEVLVLAGLGRPAVNVVIEAGGQVQEVDFCWPDRRLIVEADSFEFHRTRAAFERDRRRDQRLTAAGWTVLRITWRQLRDAPEEVVAAVVAASRSRLPGARSAGRPRRPPGR